MLLEYAENNARAKAILSGDLLCPLIEPQDYALLQGARVAYVDANTRFPCPSSGHWSVIGTTVGANSLQSWIASQTITNLLAPHAGTVSLPPHMHLAYDLCWSIYTFIQRTAPQAVALVHYSGYEDVTVHQEAILTDSQLSQWVCTTLGTQTWEVPRPGHEFVLYDGV